MLQANKLQGDGRGYRYTRSSLEDAEAAVVDPELFFRPRFSQIAQLGPLPHSRIKDFFFFFKSRAYLDEVLS